MITSACAAVCGAVQRPGSFVFQVMAPLRVLWQIMHCAPRPTPRARKPAGSTGVVLVTRIE